MAVVVEGFQPEHADKCFQGPENEKALNLSFLNVLHVNFKKQQKSHLAFFKFLGNIGTMIIALLTQTLSVVFPTANQVLLQSTKYFSSIGSVSISP